MKLYNFLKKCNDAKYIAIVPLCDLTHDLEIENYYLIEWNKIRSLYKNNPIIEGSFIYNEINNQIYF